jgi:hypothetical protein
MEVSCGQGLCYIRGCIVNCAGAVCEQKTQILCVHWEESIAGHVGVNGVY